MHGVPREQKHQRDALIIVIDAPYPSASFASPESWPSGRRRLIRNQVSPQGFQGFESLALLQNTRSRSSAVEVEVFGEVAEWSKAHDWKSCVSKGTGGSNPFLSAKFYTSSRKSCVGRLYPYRLRLSA